MIKIIDIKTLTKIKVPRYIYETVRGDESAEKTALDWAVKRSADILYRFDMGYGIKWIIKADIEKEENETI